MGAVFFAAFSLMACSGSNDNTQRAVRRSVAHINNATAREDRSRCDATLPRRTASQYDTNRDGVADVRRVYQSIGEGVETRSVLVCREVDLNHDGTKDVFRFYDENTGRTLREEEDRDFDGRIDVITYFENGEVVRRESDTNGDGRVDMRVIYQQRRPWRAERQVGEARSGEFRANYWEYYDNRGHVVRIGWDYNGDERADRWDRVDRVVNVRTNENAPQPVGAPPEEGQTPAPTPPNTPNTPPGAATPPANRPAPSATPAPTATNGTPSVSAGASASAGVAVGTGR